MTPTLTEQKLLNICVVWLEKMVEGYRIKTNGQFSVDSL